MDNFNAPEWKEIHHRGNDESDETRAVFEFNGDKFGIDEFMRTNYPDREYLKVHGVIIHATKCMSIGCNIGIQVSDDGDAVRAFWVEDLPENVLEIWVDANDFIS